jgi:hypothetical protein
MCWRSLFDAGGNGGQSSAWKRWCVLGSTAWRPVGGEGGGVCAGRRVAGVPIGSVPLGDLRDLTTVPLRDSGGLTTVPLRVWRGLTTVPLGARGGLTTVPMRIWFRGRIELSLPRGCLWRSGGLEPEDGREQVGPAIVGNVRPVLGKQELSYSGWDPPAV